MQANRAQLLSLYRALVKNGSQYKDFSIKSYIRRKAREDFEDIRVEKNQDKINTFYAETQEFLEVVKRQKEIQNLYFKRKSVVEK